MVFQRHRVHNRRADQIIERPGRIEIRIHLSRMVVTKWSANVIHVCTPKFLLNTAELYRGAALLKTATRMFRDIHAMTIFIHRTPNRRLKVLYTF